MADAGIAMRRGPLAAAAPASVALLEPALRLSVRGGAEALLRACHGFGLDPPTKLLRASEGRSRAALSLGPDELLLICPGGEPALGRDVEAALEGEPGSVVDVSHRQIGLEVAGPGSATLLNMGCPLDLHPDAFPVGMCTRTVLAKAEIVLWRTAPEVFRLEAWRSFAPYVSTFLAQPV